MHPFKNIKHLNTKWDTRNHPFYEHMFNGKMVPDEQPLFDKHNVNEVASCNSDLVEGKYDIK